MWPRTPDKSKSSRIKDDAQDELKEMMKERARVGIVIHKKMIKTVKNWKFNNERMMQLNLACNENTNLCIIVAYGPSENENKQTKTRFWEQLQEAVDRAEDGMILIGDFNGKVGKCNRKEQPAIDDQDGNIILTIDEITNRWQQYYMNIMEGHLEEDMISDNNNTSNKEEYDITVQEISEAIGNL
ncbi:hypothetical protein QE152_g9247 [Popillia japonica]|uniref:Craniofacial development protein 2-like n=1 Tax=Popillia japonica TaxID=7064 RepID=A0AAW1LVE0_POPJA